MTSHLPIPKREYCWVLNDHGEHGLVWAEIVLEDSCLAKIKSDFIKGHYDSAILVWCISSDGSSCKDVSSEIAEEWLDKLIDDMDDESTADLPAFILDHVDDAREQLDSARAEYDATNVPFDRLSAFDLGVGSYGSARGF